MFNWVIFEPDDISDLTKILVYITNNDNNNNNNNDNDDVDVVDDNDDVVVDDDDDNDDNDDDDDDDDNNNYDNEDYENSQFLKKLNFCHWAIYTNMTKVTWTK